MTNGLDFYNKELLKKVNDFEQQYGELPESAIKHFLEHEHKMILEDCCFLDPDLKGLEKYEDWLNE